MTVFDPEPPGSQTSFGNAGLFASHECVTANSPNLWQNIPGMLFNQDNPIVIDWIYILKHLPWAFKFLKNCTSKKTEYIAESLSSFSRHSVLAYDEIFNVVDTGATRSAGDVLDILGSSKGKTIAAALKNYQLYYQHPKIKWSGNHTPSHTEVTKLYELHKDYVEDMVGQIAQSRRTEGNARGGRCH